VTETSGAADRQRLGFCGDRFAAVAEMLEGGRSTAHLAGAMKMEHRLDAPADVRAGEVLAVIEQRNR
jgi:hypothetical protein